MRRVRAGHHVVRRSGVRSAPFGPSRGDVVAAVLHHPEFAPDDIFRMSGHMHGTRYTGTVGLVGLNGPRKEYASMVESRRGAHEREPSGSKHAAPHAAATEALDELILTLNPATHDVVKVERLGRAGQRKELSEHECAELAGDDELDELVVAVQEAYEAGVMKGLDQQHDYDVADEDLVIWQLLLD